MDLGLRDKVAVVTGGSEGIGRAAARSLGVSAQQLNAALKHAKLSLAPGS